MTTDRQRAANQRNASRSRGPGTPEGRQASSRNAVRHGVLSSEVVVSSGENRERFDELMATLITELDPQTVVEFTLVEQLALLAWRNRRLAAAERTMMEARGARAASEDFRISRATQADTAEGIEAIHLEQQILPLAHQLLIGRYRVMITNQMLQIIATLARLRADRDAVEPADDVPPRRPRSRSSD